MKILVEKAELTEVMNVLAQAIEALSYSKPTAPDEHHLKWHAEALEACQLTLMNLGRL